MSFSLLPCVVITDSTLSFDSASTKGMVWRAVRQVHCLISDEASRVSTNRTRSWQCICTKFYQFNRPYLRRNRLDDHGQRPGPIQLKLYYYRIFLNSGFGFVLSCLWIPLPPTPSLMGKPVSRKRERNCKFLNPYIILRLLRFIRNKLKVVDLRYLAKQQGICVPGRANKGHLVDLLFNIATLGPSQSVCISLNFQCFVNLRLCSNKPALLRRPHKGSRLITAFPKKMKQSAKRAQELINSRNIAGHPAASSTGQTGWMWVSTK